MGISRVELTPNMGPEIQAQAINDNFRQIESENRTKIIKDSEGKSQIVIGQNKDDNDNYGIYVGNIHVGNGFISVYDNDKKEVIRLGKLPNGVNGFAIAKPGNSITEAIT